MISLSMRPSTSIRKDAWMIGSTLSSSLDTTSSVPRSTNVTTGGVMSTFLLNIDESEVATLPIIWFMHSLTALMWSSLSS